SPALPVGRRFVYTLIATWDEDGTARSASRRAVVGAGQQTIVDFTKPEPAAKARTFLFTYAATLTGLPPGQTGRVWLPVPPTTLDQEVQIVAKDLPGEGQVGREAKYGNQILYVEAKAGPDGKVPLAVTYRVTRREVKGDPRNQLHENEAVAKYL